MFGFLIQFIVAATRHGTHPHLISTAWLSPTARTTCGTAAVPCGITAQLNTTVRVSVDGSVVVQTPGGVHGLVVRGSQLIQLTPDGGSELVGDAPVSWTGTGACYVDDAIPRIAYVGVAITAKLQEHPNWNTREKVFGELATIFTFANLIYARQLNIQLAIGHLHLSDKSAPAPWDNARCAAYTETTESGQYPDIGEQLTRFKTWAKPTTMAAWELFDDCFMPAFCKCTKGAIGMAFIGTLCHTTHNVGVTFISLNTWATFAHEMGHTFGAGHSFGENGETITAGIMSYGTPYVNGVPSFNRHRREEVCKEIDTSIATGECSANELIKTTGLPTDTTSAAPRQNNIVWAIVGGVVASAATAGVCLLIISRTGRRQVNSVRF
jgi:hypothetical protein